VRSLRTYKFLIRPVLECAAPVWNPYLVKDVLALGRVQRRASRLALVQKSGEIMMIVNIPFLSESYGIGILYQVL